MQVTQSEIDIANNVNILEYLLAIGEPLKNEGREYYRHSEHDSLVINARKNFFSWNSHGVSGNAVTYLMNVHNMKFQNAVEKINRDLGSNKVTKFERKEPVYLSEFIYNVKESNQTADVRAYLVDDRKIDPDIVDYLIKEDFIKEDIYKNVVFKWKDKNEIVGANLQGTRIIPAEKRIRPDREYFKHILPTTEEATFNGFNIKKGYPENLYFYESSIDTLSYLSLNKHRLKNSHFQSMDGLKIQTVFATVSRVQKELKQSNREIKSITLCVDNDSAGREFIQKLSNYHFENSAGKTIEIKTDIPNLPKNEVKWDWNNELKRKVQQQMVKKKNENLLEI